MILALCIVFFHEVHLLLVFIAGATNEKEVTSAATLQTKRSQELLVFLHCPLLQRVTMQPKAEIAVNCKNENKTAFFQ